MEEVDDCYTMNTMNERKYWRNPTITMALTTGKMSTIVLILGLVSFALGIIAENKKPSMGIPIQGKDAVICNYSGDPTVVLGYCSLGFLVASSFVGLISIFYSYNETSVPSSALFKYTTLSIFFILSLATSVVAAAMTLWPTLTERHHVIHSVHHVSPSTNHDCPTAKTGLMGGAAFLSLISSLFWLSSLMLVNNAREDYLEELYPNV